MAALPAVASAVQFQQPIGTKLVPGTKVSAKSTNWIIKTSWGNIACAEVNLQSGEVTRNDSVAEAAFGPSRGKECFYAGTHVFVNETESMSVGLTSPGVGSASVKYRFEFPELTCWAEGGAVPVSYKSGTSSFQVGGTLKVVPAACGTMSFSAAFSLTTTKDGKAVIIN
jgi:hypothetical protein